MSEIFMGNFSLSRKTPVHVDSYLNDFIHKISSSYKFSPLEKKGKTQSRHNP